MTFAQTMTPALIVTLTPEGGPAYGVVAYEEVEEVDVEEAGL